MSNSDINTVLITGATKGIGRELALRYASRGCRVGMISRSIDSLETLSHDVTRLGASSVAYAAADVSDRTGLEAAISEIVSRIGDIDIAIVNAGVAVGNGAKKFSTTKHEQNLKINLLGAIYTIGAVLPKMIERKQGHIVGISSLAAYFSLPLYFSYSASKIGLNRILQGLRCELHGKGVNVTTICPGFVKTKMTEQLSAKMLFLVPLDKAVDNIMKAIDKKSSYCHFPWQMLVFTKIVSLIPERLIDFFTRLLFFRKRRS